MRRMMLAALAVCLLMVGACKKAPERPGREREETRMTESASGKKVLMVIAKRDFRDEELFETRRVLESGGVEVTVASSSLDEAVGMLRGKAKADVLLQDAKATEYDAVVFVGGSGASEYWDSAVAHALATEAAQAGKVVAAICIAPVTLARAGLLKGKKATVFQSQKADLTTGGASYTGRPVEVDGRIVTADGPGSAAQFGEAILKALAE